jgi:hypothetical protein
MGFMFWYLQRKWYPKTGWLTLIIKTLCKIDSIPGFRQNVEIKGFLWVFTSTELSI